MVLQFPKTEVMRKLKNIYNLFIGILFCVDVYQIKSI